MAGFMSWGLLLIMAGMMGHAASMEGCEENLDIAFLVDTSRSMTKDEFNLQMDFVQEMADEFEISHKNTRVAVLQYAHIIYKLFCFDEFVNNRELRKAIMTKHRFFRGSTKTSRAFTYAKHRIFNSKKCGMREDSITVVVLLTDGMPNTPKLAAEEAKKLREHGVIIVTVGISDEIERPMLEEFASKKELAFKAPEFFDLELIRPDVTHKTCEAVRAEKARRNALNGGHAFTLPPTPAPKIAQDLPDCKADLLFMLDTSRSVDSADIHRQIAFAESLSRQFHVSKDTNRVALTFFTDRVYKHKCFHDHLTNVELSQALNSTSYSFPQYSTNLYRAFSHARRRMFHQSCGSRPGAFKVAFVITDGKPNWLDLAVTQANKLKESGVKLVPIGVGEVEEGYLLLLSSASELEFESMNQVDVQKIITSQTACKVRMNTAGGWTKDEQKILAAKYAL